MCENESMFVAVKKMKESAPESDCVRFLQEAAIMGQFWHPGVIALHGVVTVGEPVGYLTQYLLVTDLSPYLEPHCPGVCSKLRLTQAFEKHTTPHKVSAATLQHYLPCLSLSPCAAEGTVTTMLRCRNSSSVLLLISPVP